MKCKLFLLAIMALVMLTSCQKEKTTMEQTDNPVIAAIMAALFPGEGKHRYQWQPPNGRGYRVTDRGYEIL